jgi:hypothetical protein
LARVLKRPANPDTVWLVPALLLFAGALAWRDSMVLKLLDAFSLGALLSVAAMRTEKVKLRLTGIAEFAYGLLAAGASAVFGMFAVLADTSVWREVREHGSSRHAASVLKGALIAAPLLLVFGGLFAAADPLFQRLLEQTFQVNPDRLFADGLATGVFFWGTAGFFHLLVGKSRTEPDLAKCDPRFGRLGAIELSMVLGLLDALFLIFVMLQLRYLFGGDSLVRSAIPLTYADYARRGFFELTTVAALSLPLLLLLHWLQDESTEKSRLFAIFGGLLVALVSVVILSAMQRMAIYQKAYGLTELRVYTMAFMTWLTLVFGWFAGTVLRGRRERFTFGALIAALAVVFGLHVINPDRLIVLNNADRVNTRLGFDAEYAGGLSADAIPALVSIRDALPSNERIQTDRTLAGLNQQLAPGDWRSWSWSRERAKSVLAPLTLPMAQTYDSDNEELR